MVMVIDYIKKKGYEIKLLTHIIFFKKYGNNITKINHDIKRDDVFIVLYH